MISRIIVSTRNIARKFSFLAPNQGDNALATLKDVNHVINSINNMIPYRSYDISLTQTGILDPAVTKMAVGAAECPKNCQAICTACDCQGTCQDESSTSFAASFARTGLGVYTITFTGSVITNPIKNVGFFFTPFAVAGHKVLVDRLSTNVFQLSTFNGAAPEDAIFNNTVIAMRIYF